MAGLAASVMPEAFSDLDVTIIRGEAEQLYWKLDEVLSRPAAAVHLGNIEDLDRLPLPDWSPFRPRTFCIGYDFWLFPTALIQASRGCTFKCGYCPYILRIIRSGSAIPRPWPMKSGRASGAGVFDRSSFAIRCLG